jgi:16S rRNA (guanine527-N7)-methyltransferase
MEIGSNAWSNFLINQAKAIDIKLDCAQNRLFSIHAVELIKWTQKINITTITDPLEVASKHFLDSLVPARYIAPKAELLDIGSGGGFPGIPLKVLFPELSVTLIDASQKKVNFLKHVIRTLQLRDIDALHVRAEELAHQPGYINRYSIVISRALSSLDYFVKVALPLLADGGAIIALKGEVVETELDDLRCNLERRDTASSKDRQFVVSTEDYSLPLQTSKRSIVSVRMPQRAKRRRSSMQELQREF